MHHHDSDHLACCELPEKPSFGLGWCKALLTHWERSLLLLIIGAMLAMAGSLLWPQPVAVLSLKPYPLHSASALQNDFTQTDESHSEQDNALEASELKASEPATLPATDADSVRTDQSQSKHHHRHRSSTTKPKHPSVTNLNTAKQAQLELLPGIGPRMAERIIRYRTTNGGFSTVEQVMDVKGIGPKKFEKMKPYLKV